MCDRDGRNTHAENPKARKAAPRSRPAPEPSPPIQHEHELARDASIVVTTWRVIVADGGTYDAARIRGVQFVHQGRDTSLLGFGLLTLMTGAGFLVFADHAAAPTAGIGWGAVSLFRFFSQEQRYTVRLSYGGDLVDAACSRSARWARDIVHAIAHAASAAGRRTVEATSISVSPGGWGFVGGVGGWLLTVVIGVVANASTSPSNDTTAARATQTTTPLHATAEYEPTADQPPSRPAPSARPRVDLQLNRLDEAACAKDPTCARCYPDASCRQCMLPFVASEYGAIESARKCLPGAATPRARPAEAAPPRAQPNPAGTNALTEIESRCRARASCSSCVDACLAATPAEPCMMKCDLEAQLLGARRAAEQGLARDTCRAKCQELARNGELEKGMSVERCVVLTCD